MLSLALRVLGGRGTDYRERKTQEAFPEEKKWPPNGAQSETNFTSFTI